MLSRNHKLKCEDMVHVFEKLINSARQMKEWRVNSVDEAFMSQNESDQALEVEESI